MNVLSLFDGMSCGQIALERAGIKVDNYFAAEIDKYAIQVTQYNYPKTIQLGDVTKVHAKDLPKIDLLIGGSPCQGFSFAGKQLNFDDERSKLFFEFVRLLKECNPKYFLLENVGMKREYELIISKYVGIAPIEIDSSLVSAQNRFRLYWTNISAKPYGLFGDINCTIPQPKDKGILLQHILEETVDSKYFLSAQMIEYFQKRADNYNSGKVNVRDRKQKGSTLTARIGYDITDNYVLVDKEIDFSKNQTQSKRAYSVNGKGATLTANSVGRQYKIVQTARGYNSGGDKALNGKTPTLSANSWHHNNHLVNGLQIRRLSPLECERLQTVPENYTNVVSDTQRYRMLGNGWTVDVISHIFNFIK